MPSILYYANNYAGMIDKGLAAGVVDYSLHGWMALVFL